MSPSPVMYRRNYRYSRSMLEMAAITPDRKSSAQFRLRSAVKDTAARWGNGWNRLGSDLQEALVRAEILAEINRLDSAGTDPAAYRALVEELATVAMQWTANAEI